jgi:hypothetical protein
MHADIRRMTSGAIENLTRSADADKSEPQARGMSKIWHPRTKWRYSEQAPERPSLGQSQPERRLEITSSV